MNLITVYNNDPELISGEFDIFLLAREGLSSHYQHETTNLIDTIEMIHKQNKKAYGLINRFIFEDEMDIVKERMNELIDLDIDGFVVNDFGLFYILRDLGFEKPISLVTNTTMTNHLEIRVLANQGFDKVLTARELTFEEIIELAKTVADSMIVPIFGHQIISTSRRQLITAYSDLIEKELESYQVYRLRESNRKDYFLVYQDETGTHIFDEKLFIGFEGVQELIKHNVSMFWVDSFNLSTQQLIDAAKSLKLLSLNQIDATMAINDFLNKYPQTSMSTALWTLKTAEKKEDLE
ncbi:MAG TPA: hypothetical protein GX703_03600 [Erysipelothrix sp.]|nr:hypothetical protein [Erysipelothrix sp.]